ncbi:MAG TPA: hypothetical protein VHQ92_13400 [Pseudolabrys sp.]|jgi:hypothetical protein|nr:hypothetical protein [Pseudolabrys sp.]
MATGAKYPQPAGPLLGPKIDPVDAAMSELDFAMNRAKFDRIITLSKRSARVLYVELAQLRFNALHPSQPQDKVTKADENED